MKLLAALAGLGLLTLVYLTLPDARPARPAAVREMADFLEHAPAPLRASLGSRTPARAPASVAPVAAAAKPSPAEASSPAATLIQRYLESAEPDPGTLNELQRQALPAITEIQRALSALPNAGAEARRIKLLYLTAYVGASDSALPTAETVFTAEIRRRAKIEEAGAEEARIIQVLNYYDTLIKEPAKRADFLRAGIEAQELPHVRQMMQDRLELVGRTL